MIFIDYLFGAFYAVSYEDLPINQKRSAGSYASLILAAPIAGCLAIIIKFFYHIRGQVPADFEIIALLLFVTCYGIVNWFYSRENRDFKVYEEYKARHKVMSKSKFVILAVIMMCVPFCVVGFI